MGKIYNKLVALPDETTLSYLQRLAEANGFFSVKEMMNALAEQSASCYRLPTSFQGGDLIQCMPHIVQMMGGTPFYDFLLSETTAVPYIWPMLSRDDQDRFIFKAAGYQYPIRSANPISIFDINARYCPECRKLDIQKYGIPYLHRIHQLPEIAFCPTHHVSLKFVETDKPIESVIQLKYQTHYEKLVRQMLNEWLPYSREDVARALNVALGDIRKNNEACDALTMKVNETGCHFTRQGFRQAFSQHTFGRTIQILLLGEGFSDISELKDAVIANGYQADALKEQFETALKKAPDYALKSDYNDRIIVLEHSCGRRYLTTPHAFIRGWRCPDCDAKAGANKLYKRVFGKNS